MEIKRFKERNGKCEKKKTTTNKKTKTENDIKNKEDM